MANLTIFQKIQKKSIIKNITRESYQEAPEVIKNDPEVIVALVTKDIYAIYDLDAEVLVNNPEAVITIIINNPNMISEVDQELLKKVFNNQPNYITRLDYETQKKFLRICPQAIKYLADSKIKQFIYLDRIHPPIAYLSIEDQKRLLTEKIKIYEYLSLYEKEGNPADFKNSLEFFNPQVVIEIFKQDYEAEMKVKSNNAYAKYYSPYSDFDLAKLPVSTQVALAKINNQLLERMSYETCKLFVGDNPLLMSVIPSKYHEQLVMENPLLINGILQGNFFDIAKKSVDFRPFITDYSRCSVLFYTYDNYNNSLSLEDLKVGIACGGADYSDLMQIMRLTDRFKNPDYLIEIGCLQPAILWCDSFNTMKGMAKARHIVKLYEKILRQYPNTSEIIAYINRIDYLNSEAAIKRFNNLAKLFTNNKILQRVNANQILDYVQEPTRDKLLAILNLAYGPNAIDILNDRPNIDIEDIPNFYIFNESIIKYFGLGTIHNMLSYYSNLPAIIVDFVKNPELFTSYQQFNNLAKEYFGETPSEINASVKAFYRNKEIFNNFDYSNLTEAENDSFLLYLNDTSRTAYNYCPVRINNQEDIKNYSTKRNQVMSEAFAKITDYNEAMQIFCQRFFGIPYRTERENSINSIDIFSMIYKYSLDTFITDQRTTDSGLFDEEELDFLELLCVINSTKDLSVLRTIYQGLDSKSNILKPIDFIKTSKKVPLVYSQAFVDTLTTLETMERKIAAGEPGINKSTKDGVDIITFSGADFRIFTSGLGMNNSGLRAYSTSADFWRNYEHGVSTISGCYIEPKMLFSCADACSLSLGFCSFPPEQILGMAPVDAKVTHFLKVIDPFFLYNGFEFEYPEELIRRTAAQINDTAGETRDVNHKYNEVAIMRRMINPNEIKANTSGGRVMPDYIVVIGGVTDFHIKMAKEYGSNGIPLPIVVIDKEKYFDRSYQRAHENIPQAIDREPGELLTEIKEEVNIHGI